MSPQRAGGRVGLGTAGIWQKEGGPRDTREGWREKSLVASQPPRGTLENIGFRGVCDVITPLLVSPSASSEKAEERGSLGGGRLGGGVWAVLLPSCVVLRKLLSVSELQLSPCL